MGRHRTALEIDDPCPVAGGYSRRVTGVEDSLARLRLVAADTKPGKEVFVELRTARPGARASRA